MPGVDEAILRGQAPAADAVGAPAAPGESYYWDCIAEGLEHDAAVVKARRQMGEARASVARVENARIIHGRVPAGVSRPKTERVTASIPADLLTKVDTRRGGIGRSEVIRQALVLWLTAPD